MAARAAEDNMVLFNETASMQAGVYDVNENVMLAVVTFLVVRGDDDR